MPFSRDLPDSGIKPRYRAWQVVSLPLSHQGSQGSPWKTPTHGSLPELCRGQAWGPARTSSPIHVVDIVGLGRVSKAHASLPDVFTAVQGVNVLCGVLGTGSKRDQRPRSPWGGKDPHILLKTDPQSTPGSRKAHFPSVWCLLSPV